MTTIIKLDKEFVLGERQAPAQYTFKDQTGAPISLLNFTAKLIVKEKHGQPTTYDATVDDVDGGIVGYVWTGAEITTPGTWYLEFWVGNGGVTRYASDLIEIPVRSALGPIPTI